MNSLFQGAIVLCQHRDLSSPKPHFFIVLNKNPNDDNLVLLTVATSTDKTIQKDILTLGYRPESCVELDENDSLPLTHKCYVDCNSIFTKQKLDLLNDRLKMKRANKKKIAVLNKDKMEMIISEVLKSPAIEEKYKKIIR